MYLRGESHLLPFGELDSFTELVAVGLEKENRTRRHEGSPCPNPLDPLPVGQIAFDLHIGSRHPDDHGVPHLVGACRSRQIEAAVEKSVVDLGGSREVLPPRSEGVSPGQKVHRIHFSQGHIDRDLALRIGKVSPAHEASLGVGLIRLHGHGRIVDSAVNSHRLGAPNKGVDEGSRFRSTVCPRKLCRVSSLM